MTGRCTLNNMSIRNLRREQVYQAIMIDLAMLSVISREECEMMIGGSIPENITLPDGSRGNIVNAADIAEDNDASKED